MQPRTFAPFLIAFLALTGNAFADVQLPGIISDHNEVGLPASVFRTDEHDEGGC